MKKHIKFIAGLCTLTILLVVGCGKIGSNPKDVLSKYLDASLHGRYEKAYQYISAKDKAVKSLQEYLSEGEGEVPFFVHILASKVSYEIKEVTVTGNQAKVNVEFTEPDLEAMFMGMLGIAFMSAFGEETDEKRDEKMEKMLAEKFKGKDIPMTTRTQSFDLVKEVDGWKVFLDWETEKKEAGKERKVRALLSEAAELKKQKKLHEALKKYDEILDLGAEEVDALLALLERSDVKGKRDELQKEIKVFEEKQAYIKYVELKGFRVEEGGRTRFREPEPRIFGKIVNNGNRILKEVEVTVYFLGKDGRPIAEEDYHPVLVTEFSFGDDNKPLKPGYIKEFGYVVGDKVTSEWSGKARARITDIEFCDDEALNLGTEKVDAALEIRDEPQKEVIAFEEKQAYIDKVKITKLRVAEAFFGGLGVFGEIKNLGNQTLKKVEITIYFLDKNGKPIFEETYRPVLVSEYSFSDRNKPLKPNYVRKFGYRTDDVPSDWAKKVRAKITDIEFE